MINFFDLAGQQKLIGPEIKENISRVLEHGKFILGPEVSKLEKMLASYSGASFCITCANGTDALQIALMASGVGFNDEVIIPAFSYIATVEAVKVLGARPVYVDIDPLSSNIDPNQIEKKITQKTKAIIAVSLYGQVAKFDDINNIASQYGLTVIEDAAQSFGANYNDKKSCNLSRIGCTSFFPTKPLGCYGDGGAIFTSNRALADNIRQIARHGQKSRYNHVKVGVNSRLDTLQAAILIPKLKILDEEINKRNAIALFYDSIFKIEKNIRPLVVAKNAKSARGQYTILVKNREQIEAKLTEYGIPTSIHYPLPLYKQKAYLETIIDAPISEQFSEQVLCLPAHAYLSKKSQEKIVQKVLEVSK